MNFENIIVKKESNILQITFNRPDKLNSLNKATLTEFENALTIAREKSGEIRGIILTGSGEKSFIAGADIKEFSQYSKSQGREMVENGQRILRLLEESTIPVLAAVNGFAIGGGCEIAMACHIRIGSENAKFGQPEVKLGIIPGFGGTQRLIQIIGKSKAMELLLSGKTINAVEAKDLGLINYIIKPQDLLSVSWNLMDNILHNSPQAIKSIISCVNAFYSYNADAFNTEINEFEKCFGEPDFFEGTNAFLSKRLPDFKK
jgi:enoyl-CoA hydratase